MQRCDWLTDDDDQDSGHYLKSQREGDESEDSGVVPGGGREPRSGVVKPSTYLPRATHLYPAPCSMTVFMCVTFASSRAKSNMPSAAVFLVAYRFMLRLEVKPP